MARDRTFEFKKHIESIQGKPQYVQLNNGELRARRKRPIAFSEPALSNYQDFMRRSREAAHDLFSTYQKLQALNEMARKTTIFDWEETSKEMNELIHVIRIDIKSLNHQIEELRKYQVTGGSSATNGAGHDIESHSKTVILNLQHKLASMSSSFKSTLEMRTQKSEEQKMRREQFSSSELNSLMRKNQSSTAIDLFDTSSGTAGASGGFGASSGQSSKSQQQLLVYEDQSTAYLEDRANAMQSVETTIVELGTIFNQLATMVQQQEEMITRIDANVTDTALNVESAHQSLLQYFQTVSNNRWLMFKVFGVLVTFFIVFVLFAG